jgi:hypothetical protein
MSAALLFAGASAGLDLMSGLLGYFTAQDSAAMAESRARMIRNEAEAEAQRYHEQAQAMLARTKVAYLKSGVYLSGSPLDVLDHDILTAQENEAAIRASGTSRAFEQDVQATQIRNGGRAALIGGITGAVGDVGRGLYYSGKAADTSSYNRKDLNDGR